MKKVFFRYFILFVTFLIPFIGNSQELKWIYKIGSINSDYGAGVALDKNQNVYDITNFSGNAGVSASISIASRGQEDILIRKSSPTGIQQWIRQLGSKSQDLAQDIVLDNQNNVYIIGTFRDSLYLESTLVLSSPSTTFASFIIKLNSDGLFQWAQKLESDIAVVVKSVTSGPIQDIVISGNFEGNATFPSNQNLLSKGGSDIFVLKLNSDNGSSIFLKQIGGVDQDFVSQHTVDTENNIYLTGDFRAMVDFDPNMGELILNSKGLTDIFLLKLTESGNFAFAKSFGGNNVDYGQSVAIDKDKNIILTGRFSEAVGFGNAAQILQSKGGTDIFLLKMDKETTTQWVYAYGGVNNDAPTHVIVNTNGIIYLAGTFRNMVDFDPSVIANFSESNGGADAFVTLYNQDGTYNEHFSFGGIANEQLNKIALKSNGEIILLGGFGAIVDFDPGQISEINVISTGSLDGFMFNVFVCVNPYLKELRVVKPEICFGENILIQVVEGYLNSATQWSWQRNSCESITFAAGPFLNIPVQNNTSFFVKGWGGCVLNDQCKKIDIRVHKDSLRYQFIPLCEGDTLKVGNSRYTNAGVYTDSLTSVSGCDSVVVTEIVVNKTYKFTNNYQICPGDTVKVGNSIYTLNGSYTNVFKTITGCDSIIISNITVKSIKVETFNSTICEGTSITIGNVIYNSAGTFIQQSSNPDGCKDLKVITIKVSKRDFFQQKTICFGDSLKVGSKVYTASGIYRDTLVSLSGCDSIITSVLDVNSSSSTTTFYQICEGDSVKVGNKVYKTSGNYIDDFKNHLGCDSTVFSGIVVFPKIAPLERMITICQGDSVVVGTKVYKAQGLYTDTLRSKNGCDSIITTSLVVNPVSSTTKFYQFCEGDSVIVANKVYKTSGNYIDTLSNYLGCDSVVFSGIVVFQKIAPLERMITICDGDSVIVGTKVYKTQGLFKDTLRSINGCDSIITTSLIVNPRTSSTRFSQICEGDSVVVGTKIYKTQGVYIDTLQSSKGCDSVIITNLKVFLKNNNISTSICRGDTLKFGLANLTSSGVYTFPFKNIAGCDSLVIIQLVVNEHVNKSFNYSICPGDSLLIKGVYYKSPATLSFAYISQNGCDSTETHQIKFNHVTTSRSITLCKGDIFVLNGKTFKEQGIFNEIIKKADGCDSIIQLTVNVNPSYVIDTLFEICKGESVKVGSSVYFNPGKFVENFKTIKGCDSIIRFEIRVTNFIPAVFSVKDTLTAFIIPGATYQWYECINNNRVPLLGATGPTLPLFKSAKFSLGVTFRNCTYFSDCLDYIRSSSNELPPNIVTLHPNPFKDFIQINAEKPLNLRVIDMQGRVKAVHELTVGKNELSFDQLISGLYIFELSDLTGQIYIKTIKL